MTLPQAEIDRLLLEIGEPLFFSSLRPRKSAPRSRRMLVPQRPRPALPQINAQAIRRKLGTLSRRIPQAMVRITGAARCVGHIRAHFEYISRSGHLPIEDELGNITAGDEAVREAVNTWRAGYPISEEGQRRESLHLVLSMPSGTSELGLQRAARDFAHRVFSEHQWVMVLHTPATDPDRNPSPHPHVHLTVKAMSLRCQRLNPRKADLQLWRELFVEALRDNGIEAAATKRQVRLQRQPERRHAVHQIEERGDPIRAKGRRMDLQQAIRRNRATRSVVLERISRLASALRRSGEQSDRDLGECLAKQFGLAARVQTSLGRGRVDESERE